MQVNRYREHSVTTGTGARAHSVLVVVLDGNLLRVGARRQSRRQRFACVVRRSLGRRSDEIRNLLPDRFLVDALARHLDFTERLRLGEFELAALLGFERFEVALRDGVNAILDLEEGRERECLRIGVPGRWMGEERCLMNLRR